MTPFNARRACCFAVLICAALPAAAHASTYTVDVGDWPAWVSDGDKQSYEVTEKAFTDLVESIDPASAPGH